MLNKFTVEFAPHPLVDRCRIEKPVRDDAVARVQRGPDHLAHQLGAARFKQQQLGLRRHDRALGRELEQFANRFANRSATRFTS